MSSRPAYLGHCEIEPVAVIRPRSGYRYDTPFPPGVKQIVTISDEVPFADDYTGVSL
jgi:hypothetical protein